VINLHDPHSENNQTVRQSRRCPPESFLSTIEAKRYGFLAEIFTELDRPVLAQMCRNWEREHQLTALKLEQSARRLADLDAQIYPLTKGGAS
jgi:hypothetical protein